MKLDTSSPVPLYQQLQEILRAEIDGKVWKVGIKLPSEHQLCAQYGVTRPTVRQALEGLVRQGKVQKQRGKGAFVKQPPVPVGLFSIQGTSDAFAAQKVSVESKVIEVSRVAQCPLSEGNDPVDGWVKLSRVRKINKVPTFYEDTFLDASIAPGLEKVDLNNQSLFRTLAEKYNLHPDGGRQRFSAVAAPAHVADWLQMRAGQPLLRVVRMMNLAPGAGASPVVRASGALLVDLYVAQGPFVLEQGIPVSGGDAPEIPHRRVGSQAAAAPANRS